MYVKVKIGRFSFSWLWIWGIVFWDTTLCSLLDVFRRLRETYYHFEFILWRWRYTIIRKVDEFQITDQKASREKWYGCRRGGIEALATYRSKENGGYIWNRYKGQFQRVERVGEIIVLSELIRWGRGSGETNEGYSGFEHIWTLRQLSECWQTEIIVLGY
jgi:hypothetical protein